MWCKQLGLRYAELDSHMKCFLGHSGVSKSRRSVTRKVGEKDHWNDRAADVICAKCAMTFFLSIITVCENATIFCSFSAPVYKQSPPKREGATQKVPTTSDHCLKFVFEPYSSLPGIARY